MGHYHFTLSGLNQTSTETLTEIIHGLQKTILPIYLSYLPSIFIKEILQSVQFRNLNLIDIIAYNTV